MVKGLKKQTSLVFDTMIINSDEPSHDKVFDTHAHDYNFATQRKIQNWFFGELSR